MSTIETLTVIGAGVLGGQIAWHSAYMGKTVIVHDIAEDSIDRCRSAHERYADIYKDLHDAGATEIADTRSRLTFTTDLAQAVASADLVIEAVPEVPAIKTGLYRELADMLEDRTIVATNTSTFLPSDFADDTGRPEKFCALHFANLIWALNRTEIMGHPGTARETLRRVTEFAIEIGMVPIPVRKEQNGLIANTLLVPLLNAAQTLVTNGVATPEDVDRTFMFYGTRFGPFGMLDTVGMNTAHAIFTYWGKRGEDPQMQANADYIDRHFLALGNLGLSTGRGYYSYPNPAYEQPDFLTVPDVAATRTIVDRVMAAQS